MALSGSLTTMPFPDLLQWIGVSRRSGSLTLSFAFDEWRVVLRNGEVVALGSDDPRANDVVRLLLARGLIDETRLRRVLASRTPESPRLQTVLLDEGHVPRASFAAALRAHVKDVLLQIFLWTEGRFLYAGEEERGFLRSEAWDLEVTPPLPIDEVLLDSLRRLDDWRRFVEVLPSDYTRVQVLGPAPDLPIVAALAVEDHPLTLWDVCARSDRPRFEVLRELHEAWRRGLLAVEAAPEELKIPDRSPSDHLLEAARVLCDERQFDEAAALLRSILNLDPGHAEARKLLASAHARLVEDLYQEMPPHRVPIRKGDGGGAALTTREAYLLSRIDGRWDVASLTVITPLPEIEALRALRRLRQLGLVTLT